MYAYVAGKFVPADKAVVPIQDRGFRFGDGVFETIALHNSIPYQWEQHVQRLEAGLKAIKIKSSTKNLYKICSQLIQKNKTTHGVLRIYVTRGQGGTGYLPLRNNEPTLVIETASSYTKIKKATLWVSAYKKIPLESLPGQNKLANALNSILARMEASDNKCFDALLLDITGHVCETSSANIFWFKDDILYTPSRECALLPGTTREAIIRLSPFKIKQDKLKLSDLLKADEVFITNSSFQVLPVTGIMPIGTTFDVGKNTRSLGKLLQQDINDYVSSRKKKMA